MEGSDVKAFLQFTALVQDAASDNTLKILMSDNFPGLTGQSYEVDSAAIVDADWTDLAASLPALQNGSSDVNLDISSFLGKKTTIAFKYEAGPSATKKQPKWTISDLHVILKSADGTEVESQDSTRRGFLPFDFYDKVTPYTNRTSEGRWNICIPASKYGYGKYRCRIS